MEQLNKPLGKGAVAVLCFLIAAVIAATYYFLIFQPLAQRRTDLEAEQLRLETELETRQLVAVQLSQMKQKLEELRETYMPTAAFDNQKPVMAILNNIMAGSTGFNITFDTDQSEDSTLVRRYVNIQYECSGYQQARQLITQLRQVPFRCLVTTSSITSAAEGTGDAFKDISTDPVNGQVSIIFFEST